MVYAMEVDMTDEEIIDALAKGVMGWKPSPKFGQWWCDSNGDFLLFRKGKRRWNPLQLGMEGWRDVGILVEKMINKGYFLQIASGKDYVEARFLNQENHCLGESTLVLHYMREDASSVPRAISKAAVPLATLEVKE